jgi:tRNA(Ile)-lysidine synthase TilS/MesJ
MAEIPKTDPPKKEDLNKTEIPKQDKDKANEKVPITKPSVLDEVLADLKKDHKGVDFSFLSTEDQVRAYRQLAKKEEKEEAKEVKKDIQTPLNVPPVQDKKIKTFLERQQEAGFAENLSNLGSYAHVANQLYKKKNEE